MSQEDANKKENYSQLWRNQSDLFWRNVYSFPFIVIAIIGGWYAIKKSGDGYLAPYLLLFGLLLCLLQFLILHRIRKYLEEIHSNAGDFMIERPKGLLGYLTGYFLGISVPLMALLGFLGLYIANPTVSLKADSPDATSPVCVQNKKRPAAADESAGPD